MIKQSKASSHATKSGTYDDDLHGGQRRKQWRYGRKLRYILVDTGDQNINYV